MCNLHHPTEASVEAGETQLLWRSGFGQKSDKHEKLKSEEYISNRSSHAQNVHILEGVPVLCCRVAGCVCVGIQDGDNPLACRQTKKLSERRICVLNDFDFIYFFSFW